MEVGRGRQASPRAAGAGGADAAPLLAAACEPATRPALTRNLPQPRVGARPLALLDAVVPAGRQHGRQLGKFELRQQQQPGAAATPAAPEARRQQRRGPGRASRPRPRADQAQLMGMPLAMSQGHTRSPMPPLIDCPCVFSISVLRRRTAEGGQRHEGDSWWAGSPTAAAATPARGAGSRRKQRRRQEAPEGRRRQPAAGGSGAATPAGNAAPAAGRRPPTAAASRQPAPVVQEAGGIQQLPHLFFDFQERGAVAHDVALRDGNERSSVEILPPCTCQRAGAQCLRSAAELAAAAVAARQRALAQGRHRGCSQAVPRNSTPAAAAPAAHLWDAALRQLGARAQQLLDQLRAVQPQQGRVRLCVPRNLAAPLVEVHQQVAVCREREREGKRGDAAGAEGAEGSGGGRAVRCGRCRAPRVGRGSLRCRQCRPVRSLW